jgi:beta-barrel assembly-enhancing protease
MNTRTQHAHSSHSSHSSPVAQQFTLQRAFFLRVCTWSLVLLTALSVSYCGLNLYAVEDDAKLGKQLDDQIRTNPKEYPILNNPQIKQYVQSLVTDLVQSPEVKFRGTFPYTVEIINDDKTINAFCTPGGYIYVYTGLMKFVDNEATLAGVLGHEIGHAEGRHSTQRMTKAYGLQMIASVVLGQNPSQVAVIGANLFSGLALLKNSRADETESDELSFKYLRSSRWYAGSGKFFFEKILAQSGVSAGSNPGNSIVTSVERLLSTHPLPQDRVDAMNKRIADAKIPAPSEANLFATRYATLKRQLP